MPFQKYVAYLKLMRCHRPIGIWLLLWPTLWGVWIASGGRPPVTIVCLFVLGCFLMRSAGCVINDWADRHVDLHVARTCQRPLVSGAVSAREAIGLFCLLCLISGSLLFWLQPLARWLALPAVILAVGYPFMKRYVPFPQLIMGIAFAWGIPMAFAAQAASLLGPCLWLCVATVLWAVAYDTVYAMVDRPDDVRVGIKSTAVWWGRKDIGMVAILHLLSLGVLVWVGGLLMRHIFYYTGLLAAVVVWVHVQWLIRTRQPSACFLAFQRSHWFGFFIWMGLVLDYQVSLLG